MFFSSCDSVVGDFLEFNHLVSEFRFIPNQTEAMEFDIFQRWKECRYLDATI